MSSLFFRRIYWWIAAITEATTETQKQNRPFKVNFMPKTLILAGNLFIRWNSFGVSGLVLETLAGGRPTFSTVWKNGLALLHHTHTHRWNKRPNFNLCNNLICPPSPPSSTLPSLREPPLGEGEGLSAGTSSHCTGGLSSMICDTSLVTDDRDFSQLELLSLLAQEIT